MKIYQMFRDIFSFFLFFCVLLLGDDAFAQGATYAIQGSVYDERGLPIPYASVVLKRQTVGTMVKGTMAEEAGDFKLEGVAAGKYMLEISMIGYISSLQTLDVYSDMVVSDTKLESDANLLDEVTITASRKVLERKSDRFVMDVGASSFQTSNVMEIFAAMPFMQVQGSQVSINGKRNILVLLDYVPLPGITVNDVLTNMNGSEVDRIEFITTPGARYDASVDAVIHIHTKKNINEGLRGILTGTGSQGEYARNNLGINLSYRQNRWTLGGKYSFSRSDNNVYLGGYRSFTTPDRVQTIGRDNTELYRNRIHNVKVDVGYSLHADHHLHFSSNFIRGNASGSHMTGNSAFSIGVGNPLDSVLRRQQDAYYSYNTQNYSLNYQGKLDSLGKRVDVIATYTPIRNRAMTKMLFQDMLSPQGDLLTHLPIVRNENPAKARIMVLQNDWELPLMGGWQIEAGAKYSASRNQTETYQSELLQGQWEILPDYTFFNDFYEDVVAAYAGIQKEIGSTEAKLGLRTEKTVMGVRTVYERHFFDFFPQVMLRQRWGERNFMFNYRRTIVRPSFNQLAPFRTYVDDFLIIEGNLNLRPTYATQLTLNGDVVKDLFLELSYNHQKDIVIQLPRQEGEVTIAAPMNMNGSELAANLTYDYQFASWWKGNAFVRGFRYTYNGILNQATVADQGYAYNFGLTGTFQLPAAITLDASYNYLSPDGYAGFHNYRSNFARLALRRSFWQDRVQLTLAMNDIFMGQYYRSEQVAGNLMNYYTNYYDTQRVSLGFVFNFGRQSVKNMEDRKLGNEEVINRVN